MEVMKLHATTKNGDTKLKEMIPDNKALSHDIDVLISTGILEQRKEKDETKINRNATIL